MPDDQTPNPAPGEGDGKPADQPQSFTQADVDRIVADRLKREREATRTKYADYDDLKTKADGAKSLEDRVAELEGNLTAASTEALRARIAGEFGISTKPGEKGEASDADLLLTGKDEDSMRAQAERLAARAPEHKPNHVPREGDNPRPGDDPMRTFTRSLFARATTD